MYWGIRLAAILVITCGLLWLNWDRFSEQTMEPEVQNEAVPEASLINRSGESAQEANEASHDSVVEQNDSESASPEMPEFELQAQPESLDESDAKVRSVAQELSPAAAGWLKPEEQLRKWTLLVKQAAEGKILYEDRPFTFNAPEFVVEERGNRYFIGTQNFARYEPAVDALVKLPADKFVAYYRSWYPLLEQAFAELGLSGSFDERLDSVIERILTVEVLEGPIELKKPTSVTYKFMDPELEGASQIDKWLWRMGPENARQIQDLANRLKQELEKSRN